METPNGSDRPITLKDLTDFEARIERRFTDSEARFEGRFTDFEARIEGRLADSEARTEDRVIKAVDHRLEDLETKLLSAFYGYGERTDLRLKRIETAEETTASRVASLEAEGRLTALELRVIQTEKRLRKIEEGLK